MQHNDSFPSPALELIEKKRKRMPSRLNLKVQSRVAHTTSLFKWGRCKIFITVLFCSFIFGSSIAIHKKNVVLQWNLSDLQRQQISLPFTVASRSLLKPEVYFLPFYTCNYCDCVVFWAQPIPGWLTLNTVTERILCR